MKRNKVLTGLVCALALLTACGKAAGETAPVNTPGRETEGLIVFASFYPLYDFAQKLGGEHARVTCLVAPGSEPHDWEPTPAEIAALYGADLFIHSGTGLEDWVPAVLQALPADGPVPINASEQIALYEEDGHSHGYDPHVWLSPTNAALMLEQIRDGYVSADPGHAAYYEENCRSYTEKLQQLDTRYHEALDPLQRREIVVAHAAFGYLCREYGLEQRAAQGFSPEGEPDPATMASLIDYVRETGVKVIFFEEQASAKIAEAIARETGARTGVLNPLENLTPRQLQAGEDYFSVMEENLEALRAALSDSP